MATNATMKTQPKGKAHAKRSRVSRESDVSLKSPEGDKVQNDLQLVTLEEAARSLGKMPHNIRDYVQRGRISKYDTYGERISRARKVRVNCEFLSLS